MDDIGLHMAKRGSRARQAVGRGLVAPMHRLPGALATIGTAAMLWVGGQIFLHGLHEFHTGGVGTALLHVALRSAGGWLRAAAREGVIKPTGGGWIGWGLGG